MLFRSYQTPPPRPVSARHIDINCGSILLLSAYLQSNPTTRNNYRLLRSKQAHFTSTSITHHIHTTIAMASSQEFSPASLPMSLPPPTDLSAYARSMHQHTKRQMDAMSEVAHRHSTREPNDGVPAIPNGVSSTSTTDSRDMAYHD